MKSSTGLSTIADIKSRHDELYQWVIQEGQKVLPGDPDYEARQRKIDALIEDIEAVSATSESLNDYNWLNVTAIKWNVIFSSIFGMPRNIRISQPNSTLLPSLPRTLTEEEIDYISQKAAERAADTFLASEILDGKINFAGRIAPRLYGRLERAWLKDVKLFRAYFLWLLRGGGIDPVPELGDYYAVCEHIRRMLVNPGIKARASEFGAVKEYIEDRYLGKTGIAHPEKVEATQLIEAKAYRISETTGQRDHDKNWRNAETYVKMFYENIIPAVLEDNEENTLSVLKAFQFSKTGEERGKGYWIINSFETALAIYFLNPNTIEKLWKHSAGMARPESSVVSSVPIEKLIERKAYRIWESSGEVDAARNWATAEACVGSWTRELELPENFKSRFVVSEGGIMFMGVMTEKEKLLFLDTIKGQEHWEDAINILFEQSRLIHRETTL